MVKIMNQELKIMGLRKVWLNINGANRMLICDPDKDTLSTVLRRIGLTGTKIGCNAGQCGACSVILNGEVIRSCVKKMKNVPDNSKVVTIEGVGTPSNLHPLQQAWITYGGVQCGFCTPGFIVSAKGLLDTNPSPTREEVRAWFQKHRNLCRCTGYKPLVDAVMAAAKVLRGEWTMDDITYKIPASGRAYGTRFPRRESGVSRVTGLANYGDDLGLHMPEDTLHLAPVMTKVMHANIKGIDDTAAMKMPGVVKVITAKDVKGTNRHALPISHPRAEASGLEWPIICDDKINRYGDIVAVVAADTREHAREAAKAVKVELELLPEYTNAIEAILPDSISIHEGEPNLFMRWPVRKGEDTRTVFPKADHVAQASFHTTREPHLPIEPDVVQAYWGDDGLLTVHSKSQWLYGARDMIAAGIGLPIEKIRIIENETGGSFGYAVSPPSAGLAAACAMALNKPVTLTFSYPEHQWFTGKRTPSYSNIRLASDNSGKIQGLEFEILYEVGAYAQFTDSLIMKAIFYIGFPYKVPNIMGLAKSAFSNMSYGTTYRSFAAVQAFVASESIIDIMAENLGMDPFEFRYKNIIRPGDLSSTNRPFKEYPVEGMMDLLRPKYDAAVARAKAESTQEKKRGVGMAMGGFNTGDPIDTASIDLELMPDGTFVNYNTWEDQGQHAEAGVLLHTYEALRPMNVPLEKIKTVMNDTKLSPDTGLAAASRLHYFAGNATLDAAKKLMDTMRKPDGTYRTYEEMAAQGIPTRVQGVSASRPGLNNYDVNRGEGDAWPEVMYVIFMAEVEVDTATGATKVLKLTCVGDVGVIGNVLGVEGQAYGGMSHSLGFALKTDFSDMQKHATMKGAGITEIEDMPDDIELIWSETYREHGPHGSAGCAEAFQCSGHVAILNAINSAVGVRIYDVPATPEKVKKLMDLKAQGKEYKPEKYYLGPDFYEDMDYIEKHPAYWDFEMTE
jgi:aldehyde oxidoreductase